MGNSRSGSWPETRIELTADERTRLERLARMRVASYREVLRARALLLAADGERNRTIARTVGTSERSVFNWRKEFVARGLECLRDRPRAGCSRRFSPLSARRGGPHRLPTAGP